MKILLASLFLLICPACSTTNPTISPSINHQIFGGTITIKISGNSNPTEINYRVLKIDEIKEFKESNPVRPLIELLSQSNQYTSNMPWREELRMKDDEVLLLKVIPVNLKGHVAVEIWELNELKKRYIIKSGLAPLFVKYNLD